MSKKCAVALLAFPASLGALALYLLRQRNWGATREERDAPLPGDASVAEPNYVATRAITVDAPPEAIYPWLLQMGKGRGGLYSYDFLDRLFGFIDAPSAKEILPEFQALQVGDRIPLGRGADFPVALLEPNHAFVLADADAGWTWQTVMIPIEGGRTRLVTRNRARVGPGLGARLGLFVLDAAAFVMVRRWLQVLKQRAESLTENRVPMGELR